MWNSCFDFLYQFMLKFFPKPQKGSKGTASNLNICLTNLNLSKIIKYCNID